MQGLSDHEQQLFEMISQILDELEVGLPAFAAVASEQVYKAYPEISRHFDRRQVKALQKDVQIEAKAQTAKIIGVLADEDLWKVEARKVRETLHQNTRVWQQVQQISAGLDTIMEKYGYPPKPSRSGVAFVQNELTSSEQLPNHDKLKILAIKYWTLLMRLNQQRVDQVKQDQAEHHRKLDEMWHH